MKRFKISILLVACISLCSMGCIPCKYNPYCITGTAGDEPGDPQVPVTYPLAMDIYTTLQQVWAPIEPNASVRSEMNNGDFTVYQHPEYDAKGLGVALQAGIPWIEHLELSPGFVEGDSAQRKSLAYIWLVADPQIIDEESPIRMEGYAKVYRPHGPLSLQVFEAHLRTAERISQLSGRPFDFGIIAAGDMTDCAQKNEFEWLLTALNGGTVDPDSGVDNDPDPGPGNDYNDPFISDGLAIPWYPSFGNHDVLYMGGFGVVNDQIRNAAVDDHMFTNTLFNLFLWHGYVAGDTLNGDIVLSPFVITPTDADRLPLYKSELLQMLHDADGNPPGHGFTQDDVDSGTGYYSTYPIPGKPIRMIVLDTTNPKQSNPAIAFQGSMDLVQFSWLEEELSNASINQEVVIIVSHHRSQDFHRQILVSGQDIKSLLLSHDNVILHLAGHGHANTKKLHTNGEKGYWELMTASTVDFPMQSRIIELVDEGNGFLSVYITNIDHNSPVDSLAHKARQLAGGKLAFGDTFSTGDTMAFWANDTTAQNLLLRFKLSNDISNNLGLYTWPTTIESVETLANF